MPPPTPNAKDPQFSEVVELDDGTRVSARAAFLLDQMEAADAELRRMDRTDRRWKIVGSLVLVLVLMTSIYLFARQSALDTANVANSGQITDLKGQISQLQTDGHALEKQVRQLGAQPVVTVPAPQAGPPGAQGQPGATPTDAALLTLIRRVISENPPKDGKTPTAEELLAIIKPLIPAAVPGPQGTDGKTPTDAQLLALIRPLIPDPVPGPEGKAGATGAKGDTGETGPQGPAGAPGPTCPDGFSPVEHQDTNALGQPVGPTYLRCS